MRLTDEDAFNTKGHSPGQGRFVGTYAHVPFSRLLGESGRFRLLVVVDRDRSLGQSWNEGMNDSLEGLSWPVAGGHAITYTAKIP